VLNLFTAFGPTAVCDNAVCDNAVCEDTECEDVCDHAEYVTTPSKKLAIRHMTRVGQIRMSCFKIPYIRMYLPYIPYNAVFRIYKENETPQN
jgi:hypothetical protein